jgi:hypothetical protein
MATSIVFNAFWWIAVSAEISLIIDLSKWHAWLLVIGIVPWFVSLVLGLMASTATINLPGIRDKIKSEPVNDPYGNQVPPMDLVVPFSGLSLLFWVMWPTFEQARQRGHQPPAYLSPGMESLGWVVLLDLLIVGALVSAAIRFADPNAAENSAAEVESGEQHNEDLRVNLIARSQKLAEIIAMNGSSRVNAAKKFCEDAPKSIIIGLDYVETLDIAMSFLSRVTYAASEDRNFMPYKIARRFPLRPTQKTVEWAQVQKALIELAENLSDRQKITNELIFEILDLCR